MSDPKDQPRRRRRPSTPPPVQGSPVRGVILVVIAVFVGFLFLRDDSTSADIAVGTNRTTIPAEDPESTTTSSTTPARSPAQVKVLVANGSGVTGAAGRQTNELETLGYVTGTPTDAPDRVETSVVYYRPTYQAEAETLAGTLGLDPTAAVVELPTVPPVPDMQLANLLLIIGPDLATAA